MKTLCLLLGVILGGSAEACLGPDAETRTFFVTLPAGALARPFVARVQIVSSSLDAKTGRRATKVRVLESLRRTKANATMMIITSNSSCDRDPELRAGRTYFVVGTLVKQTFSGTWTRRDFDWPLSDESAR